MKCRSGIFRPYYFACSSASFQPTNKARDPTLAFLAAHVRFHNVICICVLYPSCPAVRYVALLLPLLLLLLLLLPSQVGPFCRLAGLSTCSAAAAGRVTGHCHRPAEYRRILLCPYTVIKAFLHLTVRIVRYTYKKKKMLESECHLLLSTRSIQHHQPPECPGQNLKRQTTGARIYRQTVKCVHYRNHRKPNLLPSLVKKSHFSPAVNEKALSSFVSYSVVYLESEELACDGPDEVTFLLSSGDGDVGKKRHMSELANRDTEI
ncbi:hypothetical protein QBC46DRAFT_7056 [Diplogelasinospora grovesii]|uniref:Uncharacterized protein n=1 Tax=Diplogelasinospora grovesii TaxID=303347 RepID=A0AAN6NE37_9PEZI|nr:hypothetical protein QBC46DRAFT_7056 [Diplogelasinospora grovesii]